MNSLRVIGIFNDETPDKISGIMPFDKLPGVGDSVEVYNFKTNTARRGYIVTSIKNGCYDITLAAGEQMPLL